MKNKLIKTLKKKVNIFLTVLIMLGISIFAGLYIKQQQSGYVLYTIDNAVIKNNSQASMENDNSLYANMVKDFTKVLFNIRSGNYKKFNDLKIFFTPKAWNNVFEKFLLPYSKQLTEQALIVNYIELSPPFLLEKVNTQHGTLLTYEYPVRIFKRGIYQKHLYRDYVFYVKFITNKQGINVTNMYLEWKRK